MRFWVVISFIVAIAALAPQAKAATVDLKYTSPPLATPPGYKGIHGITSLKANFDGVTIPANGECSQLNGTLESFNDGANSLKGLQKRHAIFEYNQLFLCSSDNGKIKAYLINILLCIPIRTQCKETYSIEATNVNVAKEEKYWGYSLPYGTNIQKYVQGGSTREDTSGPGKLLITSGQSAR